MAKRRSSRPSRSPPSSALMVRLDSGCKALITRAARLRRTSISDYVRTITVAQARREVQSASSQTISLTPDEQLRFWEALQAPPRLTAAQKRLGGLLRGEA